MQLHVRDVSGDEGDSGIRTDNFDAANDNRKSELCDDKNNARTGTLESVDRARQTFVTM